MKSLLKLLLAFIPVAMIGCNAAKEEKQAPKRPNIIFIVADDIGNFWSYGSIAICAAVILFPKLRPGSWNKHASGHR